MGHFSAKAIPKIDMNFWYKNKKFPEKFCHLFWILSLSLQKFFGYWALGISRVPSNHPPPFRGFLQKRRCVIWESLKFPIIEKKTYKFFCFAEKKGGGVIWTELCWLGLSPSAEFPLGIFPISKLPNVLTFWELKMAHTKFKTLKVIILKKSRNNFEGHAGSSKVWKNKYRSFL